MSFKSSVRKITLVAALLALSSNVAGQYSKTETNTSSTKQLENMIYAPKSDISDKVKDTLYYAFNDKNLILDQYTNIPVRNENNPVYETLLFDKTDNSNRFFCYVYPRNYEGLRNTFRKAHDILEKNNVNERSPEITITNLPDLPTMPEGSIHKDHTLKYMALDAVLSLGGYIQREFDVRGRTAGHTIEVLVNDKEYIVKIYTRLKARPSYKK